MIVNIKGVIVSNDDKWVYDWFDMDSTSPNDVLAQIEEAKGDELEVIINSGGGSVYAGSEIYTTLKDYKGDVTVKIVGIAASAASVAAMSGKKVLISPTAQLMIHNTTTIARGDYRALRQASDFAKNYNKSIANAYILKSGLSQEELLNLMDKETWLTAQQALEKGLVDEIMFDDVDAPKLVASMDTSYLLPPEVIDKMRNELVKNKATDPSLQEQTNNEDPATQETEEVDTVKDLAELQAKHPDIYQAAVQAGATQERARIKAIDEISATVDPALAAKAKFDEPISAEALAFQALKADVGKGRTFDSAREEELTANNKIPAAKQATPDETKKAEEAASIDAIAASANRGRMEGKAQ